MVGFKFFGGVSCHLEPGWADKIKFVKWHQLHVEYHVGGAFRQCLVITVFFNSNDFICTAVFRPQIKSKLFLFNSRVFGFHISTAFSEGEEWSFLSIRNPTEIL